MVRLGDMVTPTDANAFCAGKLTGLVISEPKGYAGYGQCVGVAWLPCDACDSPMSCTARIWLAHPTAELKVIASVRDKKEKE